MGKYDFVVSELENEELEVLFPESHLYVRLFAYYLVENKLYDAKFLWKRIPQILKAENDDLKRMNTILQALLCNDMTGFGKAIEWDWSDDVKDIMGGLRSVTEKNINNVVGNAYSSVNAENENQTQVKGKYQGAARSFDEKQNVSTEYQISRLTEFVSFLEN